MRPLALTFCLALCVPAHATEDRDNSTPTAALWYYGQTPAQIASVVADGYRIVDLRVQATSPSFTYTAAFVKNAGTYAKGWSYYYDVTPSYLGTLLTQNSSRLTSLDAYDDGTGNVRFAAVMVNNTGAEAKGWYWVYDTSVAGIANTATTYNMRPILVREYKIGNATRYAAVLIGNTGADARGWWHFYGTTPAAIESFATTNGARVYDICSSAAPGTFDVVLVSEASQPKWWHLYGASAQTLLDFMGNTGSRAIAIEPAGGLFNAVLINNCNALSARVSAVMRGASDGHVGCYLKRVGGAVLADINGARQFVPASMVKTLFHAHAMKQVALGNIQLGSNITVWTGFKWSCPVDNGPFQEPLETVLTKMMNDSDNYRAQAVAAYFKLPAINLTAQLGLGMADTQVLVRAGCCSVTPNQMTLHDAGALHEQVATGWLGAQQAKFWELMQNDPDLYGEGALGPVLAQEAANVGLTAAQLAGFKSKMAMAYMAGDNGCFNLTFRALSAYVGLPFWTSGGIVVREYVTGTFVDSATDHGGASAALNSGAADVLRDEIHAAMLTWKDHVSGYFAAYGFGCKGTNSAYPVHTGLAAAGEPNIGTSIEWRLASGRANSAAVLYVGGSSSRWGAFGLPLSLGSLGMPGCSLVCSLDASVPATTDARGGCAIPATIPNLPALVGQHAYTQFAILDAGANALNVVSSGGLDTVVGGQK